jgi:hypothetical protein
MPGYISAAPANREEMGSGQETKPHTHFLKLGLKSAGLKSWPDVLEEVVRLPS